MSDALGKAAVKSAASTDNPIRKAQHLKRAQLAFAMDAADTGSESSVHRSVAAAHAVNTKAPQAPQAPQASSRKAATLVQEHGLRHGRPVHHGPHK